MGRRKERNGLGIRIWAALLSFGLIGQVAWVVENMYFNVFLYNTVTGDTGMIAAMVAASAVVAAVTTLAVGALSDKLGVRKPIIVTGYLLWGLSVMAFALVNVNGLEKLVGPVKAVQAAAVLVIVLDCVMTFFGSSANDAAFNAWVTDVTNDGNRGQVEAVLAVMPLVAMLVVFGALDGLTAQGKWGLFFLIVGGLTILGGGLGHVLIREPENLRRAEGNYLGNILYGLRPGVIWANPGLYLSLLALAVYAASQQVYMPYLIIYIQRYLGVDSYAVILGVVLIAASIVSVAFGRVIDKRGKLTVAVPAAVGAFAGLICMFFVRSMVTVILAGILMLGASMVLSACLQGLIRDHTPAHKAGQFQGIRIIFQVLLPMVTGPYIGSAVIRHGGETYEDLGVVKEVPTPEIFIASALVLLLIAVPVFLLRRKEPKHALAKRTVRPLLTPWGEKLDRDDPLPEYPRPQLRRDSFFSLNGRWQYAIRRRKEQEPAAFDGEIIVPFSPECLLSGVQRTVMPEDRLWYKRTFALPAGFRKDRVLLHFGAVDQSCQVFVNGKDVGGHEGGYLPFTCDITQALAEGENTLVVSVTDAGSRSRHAYGKQSFTPGGIWYTPQSGIWQTVWLESVPENHAEKLTITPMYDSGEVRFILRAKDPENANFVIRKEGEVIAEDWYDAGGEGLIMSIMDEHFRPWTPEDPFLYDVTVTLSSGDVVQSYFGMRKFGTAEVDGKKVLALNGRPIFMSGVLDQGYWSDGLYTPASDEAMVYDIRKMKECGFNMLRKHIKIEPLRWYYHCDRLGMIVWQDLVSGGSRLDPLVIQVLPFLGVSLQDGKYARFGREDPAGREQFVLDLQDTVDLLYNSPSLAVWVPFNEGWGQFDSLLATQMLWEQDPTRLVDHASGWHDQGGGDFKSRHVYFKPVRLKHDKHRVLALTEFGGYSLPAAGHTASEKLFGYRMYKTQEEFMEALVRLYEQEVIPCREKQRLSASVYTQVSDVEDEINGLLSFDRKVCKADEARLREINARLQF
ncbi:MAG: MFS transporter [Oscillospiraceae bacterium]|nr:MFS transporter [Oscillospiraceae bacterium]